MSEKIVFICENERSATVNAVDALDREIDAVWGLIAIIEVLGKPHQQLCQRRFARCS
jgi:hypothetical protein